MEDFDGIMRDDRHNSDRDGSVPMSYEDYERQQKQRKMYGIVGCLFVVSMVVAFAVNANSQQQQQQQQQQSPSSSTGGNGPGNTSPTNIKAGPISVTPRQRPPATYVDLMEVKIHEDMSAFAELGMDTSMDASTEVDVETTISDIDAQGMQTYHSEAIRMVLTMNVQGTALECDTAHPEKAGAIDGMNLCDGLLDVLGTEDEYVYNTNTGEVTFDGESAVSASSRLSNNPVEDNMRIIGILPGTEVSIGETWDCPIDLGEMGSFQGKSTFKGIVHCGDDNEASTCAEFDTIGSLDLDIQALMELMSGESGLAAMDESVMAGMQITDSQFDMKVHWDDARGYAPFSWTSLTFNLVMPNPIDTNEEFIIPVNEIITVNTTVTL